MNSWAVTVRFENTGSNPGIDTNYFQKLLQCFPSAFSQSQSFSYLAFSLSGNFESTTNKKQQLFFGGEIFNRNEIASLIHSSSSKFQDNAALGHALILEKGIDEVKKINGQFIIIYFDEERKKVFILNDHLGVQQIFYHQSKSIFLFASEIKFLLAHPESPKEIDWETSLKHPLGFPGLSSYQSYKTWFKKFPFYPAQQFLKLIYQRVIQNKKNTGMD